MKTKKPIIISLPAKLEEELNNILKQKPPRFSYKIEYFLYLLYYFFDTHETNRSDWKILNANRIRSLIVTNIDTYKRYLDKNRILKVNVKFKIGESSKKYQIKKTLLKGKIIEITIPTDSALYKKIEKTKKKEYNHVHRLAPHLKKMRKKLMDMNFDVINAKKWVFKNVNTYSKYNYYTAILKLQNNQYKYFKRNKTNQRIDTNLTNIKKELRQFIKGDYIMIDLSNSQPYLLSQLIKYIIIKQTNTICGDFFKNNIVKTFGSNSLQRILKLLKDDEKLNLENLRDFDGSVIKGKLYDDFIEKYNKKKLTRDEVKDIFFPIFFSKNKLGKSRNGIVPYAKDKAIFREVYPFVADCIEILKKNDHAKLPIFLQKLESYVFIDIIAKKLIEEGIIPFTIHDSFIVEREHEEKTLEIMKNTFIELFGNLPNFKIKNLKEDIKKIKHG